MKCSIIENPITKESGMLEFDINDFLRGGIGDNNSVITVHRAAGLANAKLRAWIEAQPVVHQIKGDWQLVKYKESTHTARLVCIEPIVKDTAEGLLRELVEADEQEGQFGARFKSACERAKRLLGK